MKKALIKLTSTAVALTVFLSFLPGCSSSSQQKESAKDSSTVESSLVTKTASNVYKRAETVATAVEAKQLLVEGNKRFVEAAFAIKDESETKRKELATKGQKPFAVIVSCSDSRVPPELVFDQALGDIFIIRDAGNVVDPVALGSVEYGVEHLHAPLIVVLGHEKCGAVKATVDGGEVTENIGAIINKIKPAFLKVKDSGAAKEDLYKNCEDENIKNTMDEIKKSPVVKKLMEEGKVSVVGAKYHIESGEVTFDY
ncbi:MAG: carbonic anhydrase [Clostridia bacterium]|nr:carbonic anhydrase [Clostridia bacterium]